MHRATHTPFVWVMKSAPSRSHFIMVRCAACCALVLCSVCNTLSAPRWSRNISNMDWAFSIQSVCNRHDQVKNWQRKELIAARCSPVYCWVWWCAMNAHLKSRSTLCIRRLPIQHPYNDHHGCDDDSAASSYAQIYSAECGATVFGFSMNMLLHTMLLLWWYTALRSAHGHC